MTRCKQCGFDNKEFTSKEKEVAEYLMQGYSNKEMANAMKVSDNRIKKLVTSMLRKRNVPDGVGHPRIRLMLMLLRERDNVIST